MIFKVGDKIILKKEAEISLKKTHGRIAWAEYILEILEIDSDDSYMIRIFPGLDRKLYKERVPDYRLATDREIKIDQIKKMFVKRRT